jgi:hypothetical protein
MKKVVVVACTLLLLPMAGYVLMASEAPLSNEAIAAILGQPGTASSCAAPPSRVNLAAKNPGGGEIGAMAFCSADCVPPNSVSCSGSVCQAWDRNCSTGEHGHVTCDSNTYWCSPTCPNPSDCDQCAQSGDIYSCCRCEGGSVMCCSCEATGDCFACCRCSGGTFFGCSQACS